MVVVDHHPAVGAELHALPTAERVAMDRAVDKLELLGAQLPFPHQSSVRGARGIRELRPRAGRSPWRGFYGQIGPDRFVLVAIGPEALVDPKGFSRAVEAAGARLREIKPEVT